LGPSHDKVMKEVWGLGDPDQDAAAWRAMAPAKNVAEISAPVLLQMPEQEARRVPELFVRLRNAGTPVELWAYPDEDHLKVEPRHRLAVYQRNLDWFRYWLQGWRDPNPAKNAQYARWDRMRDARSTRARAPAR
ncbi:MAG: prolyl oligopeptidase family serine peptidase, partial [Pseudomonadota bacterium]|nr:prolyl oligopeptidase family serine peptidase [Pseudomonadota bacterium]